MEAVINTIVIEHVTVNAKFVNGICFLQACDHLYDRGTVRMKLSMFL